MLRKWGYALLVSGILMGCSAKTDEKDEGKETNVEAEALKEEEVKEVSTTEQDLEYQKQLVKDFEIDLEYLGDHLNLVHSSIQTVVSVISTGGNLSEQDYPLLITNLETTLFFLENMQDYSELEKYKNTYAYLKEGFQYLNTSYVRFNSFSELKNQDAKTFLDIAFKGLDFYNQAFKKFEMVEETFVKEYSGNKTPIYDKISITSQKGDGIHYWKGEKEIVNGEDWNELDEDEKNQLILLDIEHMEASGIVKVGKLSSEYIELLNNHFQEQTNQSEKIKGVYAKILIEEIQNK